MPPNEGANEHTPLLPQITDSTRRSRIRSIADDESLLSSNISQEEHLLAETAVGERLPYNDYTTIDWLHDLVSQRAHIHTND